MLRREAHHLRLQIVLLGQEDRLQAHHLRVGHEEVAGLAGEVGTAHRLAAVLEGLELRLGVHQMRAGLEPGLVLRRNRLERFVEARHAQLLHPGRELARLLLDVLLQLRLAQLQRLLRDLLPVEALPLDGREVGVDDRVDHRRQALGIVRFHRDGNVGAVRDAFHDEGGAQARGRRPRSLLRPHPDRLLFLHAVQSRQGDFFPSQQGHLLVDELVVAGDLELAVLDHVLQHDRGDHEDGFGAIDRADGAEVEDRLPDEDGDQDGQQRDALVAEEALEDVDAPLALEGLLPPHLGFVGEDECIARFVFSRHSVAI